MKKEEEEMEEKEEEKEREEMILKKEENTPTPVKDESSVYDSALKPYKSFIWRENSRNVTL